MNLKKIPHLTKSNRSETQEKYQNSEKFNYTEFCDHCGRGIKGNPAYYIHLVETDAVPTNDEKINKFIEEQSKLGKLEDMGHYAIGSECVKVYPKEYRYKSNK